MPKLCFHGLVFRYVIQPVVVSFLLFCCCAYSQHTYTPTEVRIDDLPRLAARSHDPSDVLLTSLDIALRDREVCCGKDSALEDSAQRANPASLEDVAAKLQGRHLLSDGRPIMVTAQYTTREAIIGPLLIEALRKKHAMLMEWKSHIYVLYGATFLQDYDAESGLASDNVDKLLLIDPRYSDEQRMVEFDRQKDDWSKVQGVLWVAATAQ